ncbi:small GTP-binding protein [Methanocaldococcus vulcanius M7]|uniref:Small GTP-binding protein n=1 Tax=Methanocaldococcus vulcanius (strain ATCC 700851 / DSM 12094 / M7) TaxID=579137 RepID=C9RGC2_METVM|nr:NOG1 family protein [Methanocaldococcus vulcanius]ACX72624.1 small GTP-binding protein [Methanocaldococcus vulcanius M7]
MGKEANPFKKMPTILMPDELMAKALRRGEKVAVEMRQKELPWLLKARFVEEHKVRTISSVVADNLQKVIDKTPPIRKLPKFYQEMVEVLVGIDEFKKSMGAFKWASELVRKLGNEYARKIRKARTPQQAGKLRKEFVGRVKSILEQIHPEMAFIAVAREKLKELPTFKDLPTVVIAGYPNVGKSTLLKKLTGADVEINSYPFTTKGINVGYMGEIQMVDTPGLLDRPLHERNDIELQAILALNYLANVVLFVIDASEFCGYTIEDQINLLREVKQLFNVPIIVAINKIDLASEDKIKEIEEKLKKLGVETVLKISANSEINLDTLKEKLKKIAIREFMSK